MFNKSHFDDDLSRVKLTKRDKEKIEEAIPVLNTLTPEQVKAVRLYVKNRFWRGYNKGVCSQ